ncbi:MAG: DMT family transporter [Aureliella sp.]
MMDRVFTLMTLNIIAALAAGCVMALQPAVNARLSTACSHPLQASVISFGTGFLALLLIGTVLRIGTPTVANLTSVPWWAWTGGLLGTYMVTVSLLVAPQLGATRWIALVLTGQVILSLVLDHLGLIGYERQPINGMRLIGISLLLAGVFTVMRN